jgi:cobalt/nickel transport system permease protein
MQGGFIDKVSAPIFEIIPDYLVPGLANESFATIAAGLLGILIFLGVGIGVAYNRYKGQISGS